MEIAGWVAEYPGSNGPLCYGFGATELDARIAAKRQFAGADARMVAHMTRRVTARPVGADEASEVLEMLDTPW